MKYNRYDTYDFLKDGNFRRWVLSPTERDDLFWKYWLNENPMQASKALEAREILLAIQFKTGPQDATIYQQVLQDVFNEKRPARFQERGKIRSFVERKSGMFRNVAAMLVLLLLALGYWLSVPNSGDPAQTSRTVTLQRKEAKKGQKLNISLMDGSKVKVNAGSTLLVPTHFSDSQRVVSLLEGEAFFEIAKDQKKPFKVQTGDLEISVLGTAFNVCAYPSNNLVSIAVTEGKVAVKLPGKQGGLALIPGEMGLYNKVTGEFQKSAFDPAKVLAWRDGILIFEDADLHTAIAQLERWYGVVFIVKGDASGPRKFNGYFQDAALETVLEAFSFSSLFEYSLEGKTVELKMKPL